MKSKRLGWTDLDLTRVGLGTWAIGGGDWRFAWGPQDDERSIATIHRALDIGINWIDTAAVYGLGHAEEIVGRAIAGMSEPPTIATKCGRHWDSEGEIYGDLRAEAIVEEAERSLKRLDIPVIDLYQIHWPDPDEMIEEAWRAMDQLVTSGKVRYVGVSNFNVEQMQRLPDQPRLASLQPPYSMLRPAIETSVLPYCLQQDIGVIVYSPMQKGLLTGKVTREWVESLPADDHRRNDEMFQPPQLGLHMALVQQLSEIAVRSGHTLPELAIAWTLRRPEVTCAIVGARRPEQIAETASAGEWDLPDHVLADVQAVLDDHWSSRETADTNA